MYIYTFIYLCIAYISSHSKGPEQDQLRSPFVPYARNTAERSIHNFDSGPYIYIYIIYIISVTDKISRRLKYIVGSGHGMFKFVRTHSQLIRDHPLTDTLFLYIAWKYKLSQPIGDHPLWPCPMFSGLSVILFATHTLNIHSGNQTRQRNISICRGFSHVNLYSQVISHCHV